MFEKGLGNFEPNSLVSRKLTVVAESEEAYVNAGLESYVPFWLSGIKYQEDCRAIKKSENEIVYWIYYSGVSNKEWEEIKSIISKTYKPSLGIKSVIYDEHRI